MELAHRENLLPASIEELAEFVLVGRDKLDMVRAGIRALDKLDVAEGVRQQKKEEAQMLAEALLDAEARIGYLFGRMPKAQGARSDLEPRFTDEPKYSQPKYEAAKELGFDSNQVKRFEALAANPDIVEEVKQEARDNDDLATRSAALKLIKERKRQQEIERQKAAVANNPPSMPSGKFDIIYADPPWQYDFSSTSNREIENHYPTMNLGQIRAKNEGYVTVSVGIPIPVLQEKIMGAMVIRI